MSQEMDDFGCEPVTLKQMKSCVVVTGGRFGLRQPASSANAAYEGQRLDGWGMAKFGHDVAINKPIFVPKRADVDWMTAEFDNDMDEGMDFSQEEEAAAVDVEAENDVCETEAIPGVGVFFAMTDELDDDESNVCYLC